MTHFREHADCERQRTILIKTILISTQFSYQDVDKKISSRLADMEHTTHKNS